MLNKIKDSVLDIDISVFDEVPSVSGQSGKLLKVNNTGDGFTFIDYDGLPISKSSITLPVHGDSDTILKNDIVKIIDGQAKKANTDDLIYKAKNDINFDISKRNIFNTDDSYSITVVPLTASKVVITFKTNTFGSSNIYGYIVVGEIAEDNTITYSFSHSVPIYTDGYNMNYGNVTVAKLTETKVCIIFSESTNSPYDCKACIGNISGTSITLTTPAVFGQAGDANSYTNFSINVINENRVLISYDYAPTGIAGFGKVFVADIDADVFTFNTQYVFNDEDTGYTQTALFNQYKFIISYRRYYTPTENRIRIGYINVDGSITLKDYDVVDFLPNDIEVIDENSIITTFNTYEVGRYVVIGSVDGNDAISLSSSNKILITELGSVQNGDLKIKKLPNNIDNKFVCYDSNFAIIFKASDNKLSDFSFFNDLGTDEADLCFLDNDKIFIAYQTTNNNGYGIVGELKLNYLDYFENKYNSITKAEFSPSSYNNFNIFKIKDKKFGILYSVSSTNDYAVIIIATITKNDAITFTSPVTFFTNSTTDGSIDYIEADVLSDNKICINFQAKENSGATRYGRAIVGNIDNDDLVTFGTVQTYSSDYAFGSKIKTLSEDKILIIYETYDSNFYSAKAIVGIINGDDSITFETPSAFSEYTLGGGPFPIIMSLTVLTENKFIIAYREDYVTGDVITGTIDINNDISFYTGTEFLGTRPRDIRTEKFCDDKFFLTYVGDSNGEKVLSLCQVETDNTITILSSFDFKTDDLFDLDEHFSRDYEPYFYTYIQVRKIKDDKILISYRFEIDNTPSFGICVRTATINDDNSIDMDTINVIIEEDSDKNHIEILDQNRFVVGYEARDRNYRSVYAIGYFTDFSQYFSNLELDKVIGIAGVDEDNGNVEIYEFDKTLKIDGFTDLIPDQNYYCDINGELSTDDSMKYLIGKAIDENTLQIYNMFLGE